MAEGHGPKLPAEILREIVTFAHGSSLAPLRLSCRGLYNICIAMRWRGVSFRATPGNMSAMLAPLAAVIVSGIQPPTTLTRVRSATFVVLPTFGAEPPCQDLPSRLQVVLLAIMSRGFLKHLRVDLDKLPFDQSWQFHFNLPPHFWVAVPSFTVGYTSWPALRSRIVPNMVKCLNLTSILCLKWARFCSQFLTELHLGEVVELHALKIRIIQECFPQLEKLSLSGHLSLPLSSFPFMTEFRHMDDVERDLNTLPKLSHLRVSFGPGAPIRPSQTPNIATGLAYNALSRITLERVPSLRVFIVEPPWMALYVATRHEGVDAAWGKVERTQEAIDHYWAL